MTGSGQQEWMQAAYRPGLASVVIPTFNRADLIIESLESVRRQTYRPIEIVVVDDGSKDNTAELVEAWKREHCDGGLTLILIRQQNLGSGTARNVGLKISTGEFIQLLDDDDVIHPEKLAGSIRYAKEGNAGVVVGHVIRFVQRSEIDDDLAGPARKGSHQAPPQQPPYFTRLRWDGHTPLYRREVLERVGPFDPNQQFSTGDYAMRVKLSGVEILYAPFVYYYYRQDVPGALTKNPAPIIAEQKIKELEQAYKYLDAAGIEDAAEWRHLALKALKASYLAHAIAGQQELARRALALARRCGTRSRGLISLILSLPTTLLFAGMVLRRRLLRLVGKDYSPSAPS
jgi:glycosyltransferase involved in cell wall biosynthesis